jgi:hypothetical protein
LHNEHVLDYLEHLHHCLNRFRREHFKLSRDGLHRAAALTVPSMVWLSSAILCAEHAIARDYGATL